MGPVTTNVERLNTAAAALRDRRLPGDEHAARMLELCEPIAVHWAQPYAAPFVPLLEAALHLADAASPADASAITDLKRRGIAADVTPERIATYYLDHCGNCRDAEFYGHAWGHGNPHERHVPVIEDGHGPLAGQPCRCRTCVPGGVVAMNSGTLPPEPTGALVVTWDRA